jgi:glucosyl-3-phosphoglycerate synthase
MADFYQTGLVPTLHGLNRECLPRLEAELERTSGGPGIGLVLPALYSEFETPAMKLIMEELRRVRYLKRIVVALARANEREYQRVVRLFDGFPTEVTILWILSDPVQDFFTYLEESGLSSGVEGKGRSCWLSYGYLLAKGDCDIIALQDCDIRTYHRRMLARLVYPIADERMGFDFAKGYYPRYTHKLNGRVTRLFLTPLVRSLQDCGVHTEFLRFLDSFRYGLAGEFAMRADLARTMRVPSDWGLEVSTLHEVWQQVPAMRTCQVDLTECYDHKHQDLSPDDSGRGLHKMTKDIAKAMFRALGKEGVLLGSDLLSNTLPLRYQQMAESMVTRYRADAMINGLEYNRHVEESSIEVFAESLAEAAQEFLANPLGEAPLASWDRVVDAAPDAFERLVGAAELESGLAEAARTA